MVSDPSAEPPLIPSYMDIHIDLASRGPPRTKSRVSRDFKSFESLKFLNLKSQYFLKINKF